MALGSTSSIAASNPAWMRWLVPSAGDLILVTFVGLLAFTNLSVRLLGDAGIGWHVRTGQLILETHAVPRVDPFSSSMTGHPWFAWEWGYDIFVGWFERVAGLNGVVLFTALIIATVFSWTFRLLLRRGTNIVMAMILMLLAASASMIHFLARPHVLSWLFTLAWFWILEASEKHDDGPHRFQSSAVHHRLLWLLPLLTLVWVNVHGGFLVGFALLAIYWCSAAWVWVRLTLKLANSRFEEVLEKIRAGRRALSLTWTGIVCAAATLVNPFGWQLHVHIYRYLSNRFLMDHIDEFQSPNFHYVAQKCFAGLLLLTLVALASKGRALRSIHALIILLAVYSGLYASRNIPMSSLLLILVIGPWLSEEMGKLTNQHAKRGMGAQPQLPGYNRFLERMKTVELSLRGHLWPIVAIAFACWIAAHGGNLNTSHCMDAQFSPRRFPAAAVDFIEKHNAQGPIASPDYWGGYLIYRIYPRMKVVVDDRHDFYGQQFLESYLKMVHAEPGWEDFLRQHPAHLVVVPKDSALANILLESEHWQSIYNDDVARVLAPGP